MSNRNSGEDDAIATCLDEALGDQLWRLQSDDCPADLRRRLDTHLTYCAACRLQVALELRLAAGLRSGELVLPGAGRSSYAMWSACLGTAALAAGLSLVFLSPPVAVYEGAVVRGDADAAIVRPVPDELVLGGRPALRWTPLTGATSYDVRIDAVDDGTRWSTNTIASEIRVPPGAELPTGARFRVRVEPVPAHLAPDGALRTSFRTGNWHQWLAYRLGHGRAPGQWLVGGGAVAMLVGTLALLRRRGS